MGTPVPTDNEAIQCPNCWGSDKPFGSVPTPLYITCDFDGIEKGPLWLPIHGLPFNGIVEVRQSPTQSCVWTLSQGSFFVTVLYSLVEMFVQGRNDQAIVFFEFDGGPTCQLVVPNEITGIFKNGTVTINIGS